MRQNGAKVSRTSWCWEMRSTDGDGLATRGGAAEMGGPLPVVRPAPRPGGRRLEAWIPSSVARSSELLTSLRSVVAGETVAGGRRRAAEAGERRARARLASRGWLAGVRRDVRWGPRGAGGDAQTRGVSSVCFFCFFLLS